MSEWRETTLAELCTFKAGTAFPQDEQGQVAGSLPFIKVSDLSLAGNGLRITTANNWIDDEQAARLKVRPVPAGASVFAKIGEGLRSERVRLLTMPTALDNNLMAAIPRSGVTSARFLHYLMQTIRLASHAVGSALPYLKQSTLQGVHVFAPPLPEQKAIAEVLGALDDKIAANTKLAATADELARCTFLDAAAGGQEVPLSATAQFINGKAFTKGASGTGRVVIRIAELNSGIGGSTVYSDAEVEDRYVAHAGDVLFAWSGSLTLHRWFRDDAIVNQHIFKVIPNDGYPRWLVYQLIASKLAHFKDVAANKATTMGHIQRHHLDEPVLVPSDVVVNHLDPLMTALWGASLMAETENLTLAATRDAVLPQLMSGKLRVRDAEAVASGAGV